MPRPFRFQTPAPPLRAVPRGRLVSLLAQRWDRRLVTIVAGPGFGKTSLLAQALMPEQPLRGVDVWLTCEPADESVEHLGGGIAAALGLSPDADLREVCDADWTRAPQVVALVFDDVHEVPPSSPGAELLTRLLADLPGNGRMVMSSRVAVPVPTARLAAAGQLVRITELDLAFDVDEVAAFAEARDVEPSLLGQISTWPALAELTATAGADLVFDYLWEEVLHRLGPHRVELLARLAAVGGGDDEIVAVLAGQDVRIDATLEGVPLVRRADGWAALHPLWGPALRHVVDPGQLRIDRGTIALVHRSRGRFDRAVELFAEAASWDELLSVVREAELQSAPNFGPAELVRWCRMLPDSHARSPEVLLAVALQRVAGRPAESVAAFQGAREIFAARGDIDGELIAISHEGFVRWWAHDIDGLSKLYERIATLAESGSPIARTLNGICLAAISHIGGDSAGVHRYLADFDDYPVPGWRPQVQWLRSVAYRRTGDLDLARRALDDELPGLYGADPQRVIALLRIDWLEGNVEHVRSSYPSLCDRYEAAGERVLARDVLFELAAKTAFFGEIDATAALLTRAAAIPVAGEPASLHDVIRTIAEAALALAAGSEDDAAACLDPLADTAVDGPWAWYWRDRAAIALVFVLVPRTRDAWSGMSLAAPHVAGLVLADALVAARGGDLSSVRSLAWPSIGVIRAHLPARWAGELATYAAAAGNPAPAGLVDGVGDGARAGIGGLAHDERKSVSRAARRMLDELPSPPGPHLRLEVLGPLRLLRDGAAVAHPELRRQRVRELLCYVVAHPLSRRERIAEALWPGADDPAHNLRVTLNYLQRVLEPDRTGRIPPYYLRAEGQTLTLTRAADLSVDLWELEAALGDSDVAERAGKPGAALDSYRTALPLWRGEPFADAPYADWSQPLRLQLQTRYAAAAVRAGALCLAAGDSPGARDAAARALGADPYSEQGHRLLIRAHLADGDIAGARRSRDRYVAAMADLGVSPQAATLELVLLVS